ncbi:1-acylglycerol-3-phosphate O-acyltransferase 3 [Phyllostomus discolor]|uniref:1-acylglycerol-3-phosphate O-acyltransferase 3 n=1 Tax=Phyllostomus discolor TaxID=89673 RepID=A0A834AXE0_9CHIR|nr:1-acylglycerol-3-phosphate O-acyltransferase 3 [Phyllostomus discolor]
MRLEGKGALAPRGRLRWGAAIYELHEAVRLGVCQAPTCIFIQHKTGLWKTECRKTNENKNRRCTPRGPIQIPGRAYFFAYVGPLGTSNATVHLLSARAVRWLWRSPSCWAPPSCSVCRASPWATAHTALSASPPCVFAAPPSCHSSAGRRGGVSLCGDRAGTGRCQDLSLAGRWTPGRLWLAPLPLTHRGRGRGAWHAHQVGHGVAFCELCPFCARRSLIIFLGDTPGRRGCVFTRFGGTGSRGSPRRPRRLPLPPAAHGSPFSVARHRPGRVSLSAQLSLCEEGRVQRHCLSCGPAQDALQEAYNQKGVFPGEQFKPARRPWTLLNFLFWATVLLSPLFSFVLGVFASGSPLLILTFLGFVGAASFGVRRLIGVTEIEKGSSYGNQEFKKKE